MATHKIAPNTWYAELDPRKRINLATIAQHSNYRVRRLPNGTIVLDPAEVMTLAEAEELKIR